MPDIADLLDYQLIFLCGLPGCGKSTLAFQLQEQGFFRISSDQIRTQELFPNQPHRDPVTDGDVQQSRLLVYEEMGKRVADNYLQKKKTVIDATNMDNKRDLIISYLSAKNPLGKVAFVILKTDEDILHQRFKKLSNKDYESWLGLYTLWKNRLEKKELSYPTRKNYPSIDILTWKNYHIP